MYDRMRGNGPVRFGSFEFHSDSLELRRGGVPVRIEGQPLRLLDLLLSRPGALVTRDTLRRALWPDGTFVDFEHALNAAVCRLRRALGDDANAPRYVETLARRGYRFAGTVDAAAAPGAPPPEPGRDPQARLIAVLPFQNASGDDEHVYLVDGLTEHLINELASNRDLRVMARSAVFRYKGSAEDPCAIGRSLGVEALVTGAYTERAGTMRIHAELVEVARGFQLWGRSYEAPGEELTRVEQALVDDLRGALASARAPVAAGQPRSRGTTVATARREYLRGRHFLNRMDEAGIRRAVEHFSAAAAADRGYALPYGALAECYSLFALLGLETPEAVLPRAREAALAALRIDDELAEAHATLASIAKVYDRDWVRAEAGYRRALSINPSHAAAHRWYAAHLAALNRYPEALAAIQRAAELDPVSPIIAAERAWHSYVARQFDVARRQALATLDLQPGFAPALFVLGLACEQLGGRDEALDAFAASGARSPNPAVVASEAHLLAVAGRRDEALVRRARLEAIARERYVPPFWFAIAALALDGRDAAFTCLERACEQHDVWLVWLGTEPRLDPLRSHRRFQEVLARVGLATARPEAAGPSAAAAAQRTVNAPRHPLRLPRRAATPREPGPPAS
jgi:TolB-like protein/tetratricopeptide (TPR) repeat protein